MLFNWFFVHLLAEMSLGEMKKIVIFFTYIHFFVFGALAQSDSVDVAALKADLKREVLAELRAEQEAESVHKTLRDTKVTLYGFVRNYISYDTRQCITLAGDIYNLMPMDVELNAEGEDLNAVPKTIFIAFSSRFGFDIAGPTILGAASSANLEADFVGFSVNNMVFRVRHAYVQLAWEKSALLVGQTWHPSFQLSPTISGYGAGAPFSTSARMPQIQLKQRVGQNWHALLSAIFQHNDSSYGPDGKTYDYARWNLWPEGYLSLKRVGENFTFGAGVSVLSLKPRRESIAIREVTAEDGTVTSEPMRVKVNDRVLGITPELFADYHYDRFNIKGKVIYTQNASHMQMLSGFGATAYDPATGSYEYAPLRSLTTWLNATYGSKVRGGVLLGYIDNLGAKKDFLSTDDFWMFGAKNADYIYRIAPSVVYFAKNLEIGLEGDYTVVGYGDLALNGRTKALRNVANVRACLMVRYNF